MFKVKIIFYWLIIRLLPRFKSRSELEQYQKEKLASFIRNTLTKSAFYNKFIHNSNLQLSEVPLMNKQAFMDHFDTINTNGLQLKEAMDVALNAEFNRDFSAQIRGITVGLSTGTSGNRGIFLASDNERAQWTALVMSRVIRPKLFQKQKIAFFLRANSNLYASVSSSLFEFRYYDIFQPIEKLLVELNLYQPDIVAAQPSILLEIASACEKDGLQLKLQQIISFAEVLHEYDRTYIQKHLNAKITEVYQCTEGFLGASCTYGTIHINEEFLIMEKEPIDEVRFYPIVTDFSRTTQPVVRYKLDDVLVSRRTPCPCGSVTMGIERIEGRDDDVLVFGNKKLYPDLLARRIALHTEHFNRYQIIQTAAHTLQVYFDVAEELRACQQQLLQNVIQQLLQEQNMEDIHIQFMGSVSHEKGSKFRKIKRLIL